MKKLLFLLSGIVGITTLAAFTYSSSADDLSGCLKKVDSKWGEECKDCKVYKNEKGVTRITYDDTYSVYLQNDCSQTIECKVCVQEESKKWNCISKNGISKGMKFKAYACKGTGKYLYWVRALGDKEIDFPTDDEVNEKYKD